jgi:decaprenylphospho-beta-D-ribofuranose 2-oxidase
MSSVKQARIAGGVLAACTVAWVFLAPLYRPGPPPESHGVLNDVAGLNRTVVRDVVQPKTDDDVRRVVSGALSTGAKITIAGRRHSMGGQTLYPEAISIDMLQFNKILSLDIENKILVVQSGTTWRDIQEFLNPYGLAVLTMQGPNVFTVGGSMSVNAHGWDMRHGPVAASIEWFRILMADGSIKHCSRTEDPEIFHLVLGGYGLFGVILEVGLHVTDNAAYIAAISHMDFTDLPAYFDRQIRTHPQVELAEADLSVASSSLLREAIAVAYERQIGDTRRTDPLEESRHISRDRYFFDLSRDYGWGKTLRWFLQGKLEYPGAGEVRTRNNIFRSPIERIQYYSAKDTDILQEYFVPPQNFVSFTKGLTEIVARRHLNLLDATVRYVEANEDAFLNYARHPALAVVLYTNMKTSQSGLEANAETTREIIELALKNGGTFYLPYVLDFDKSELNRAYPMVNEFLAAKKRYDPHEEFSSDFYAKYSH